MYTIPQPRKVPTFEECIKDAVLNSNLAHIAIYLILLDKGLVTDDEFVSYMEQAYETIKPILQKEVDDYNKDLLKNKVYTALC